MYKSDRRIHGMIIKQVSSAKLLLFFLLENTTIYHRVIRVDVYILRSSRKEDDEQSCINRILI